MMAETSTNLDRKVDTTSQTSLCTTSRSPHAPIISNHISCAPHKSQPMQRFISISESEYEAQQRQDYLTVINFLRGYEFERIANKRRIPIIQNQAEANEILARTRRITAKVMLQVLRTRNKEDLYEIAPENNERKTFLLHM